MAPGALLPRMPLINLRHRTQLLRLPASGARTTSSLLLLRASSDYWASANADIQAHLERTIQIRQPLAVFEPMRHLTFSAPETTAPALCVIACELVGGSREQGVAAGSALRLIHAAASTHEGLLSSAHEPRPSTVRPFGPNIELLTGDGMIPFGFELLAASSWYEDQESESASKVVRVIVEMARVAGSQGMVEGQYMNEIEMIEGEHWVERVLMCKHGQLHECGGACGAILGGGGEEEIQRLRRYGRYVGVIQGIAAAAAAAAKGVGRSSTSSDTSWLARKLGELRELALDELKAFDQQKVEPVASLVHFGAL